MKKIKLITGLATLATLGTSVTVLASCSKEIVVNIDGGSYDKELSHIELNKKSTIYLIPKSATKTITGVKKVVVGGTKLTTNFYELEELESSKNKLEATHKLIIHAEAMTSRKISIELDYGEGPTPVVTKTASYKCDETFTTAGITLNAECMSGDLSTATKEKSTITLSYTAPSADINGTCTIAGQNGTIMIATVSFLKEGTDVTITLSQNEWENIVEGEELSVSFSKDEPVVMTEFEGVDYATPSETECLVKLTSFGKAKLGTLAIPGKIKIDNKEKIITGIAKEGFAGAQVEGITFESDDIKVIQSQAFAGCTNLTQMIIPKNVTSIEAEAFKDCTGLTTGESAKGVDFQTTTGWKQISGSAITIGDPITDNATNLLNCEKTSPNNWGYTGIERETKQAMTKTEFLTKLGEYVNTNLNSTKLIFSPKYITGGTLNDTPIQITYIDNAWQINSGTKQRKIGAKEIAELYLAGQVTPDLIKNFIQEADKDNVYTFDSENGHISYTQTQSETNEIKMQMEFNKYGIITIAVGLGSSKFTIDLDEKAKLNEAPEVDLITESENISLESYEFKALKDSDNSKLNISLKSDSQPTISIKIGDETVDPSRYDVEFQTTTIITFKNPESFDSTKKISVIAQ